MLVLLKNNLNYRSIKLSKDNIFKCFFKMLKNLRPEEENIIKEIRNIFRLKK